MVLHTRRRLLTAGLGTVSTSLIAGCTEGERPDSDEPNENGQSDEDEPGLEEPLTDLSVETVRFEADIDRLIDEDDDAEDDVEDLRLPYLVDKEQLDLIDLRGDPIEDIDDPLSFLREIDYDESTGLLLEREVDACHRYTLQYVEQRSSGEGVRTQFCLTTRGPDLECDIDDRHIQLTMIELPFATDEPYSGSGSEQSHICTSPTMEDEE